MLAQQTSVDNVAEDVFAANATHAKFDQTIAQKDASTGGKFLGEIGEGGGDTSFVPGDFFRSDGDNGAGF